MPSSEWEEWNCTATCCYNIDDVRSVPQDKECPDCGSEQIVYYTDNYRMTKYMMCMDCDYKWHLGLKCIEGSIITNETQRLARSEES